MDVEVFVDTNILLYTIDEDPASAVKREQAQRLVLSKNWGWSVQVAAEFFVNATSPKRPFRLSSTDDAKMINAWLAFPTQTITTDLVRSAIDYHIRFQLSYWDAAIIAAAKQMGTTVVYSEDLNDGQVYDEVRVVNPFASSSN
jgi:predicted nucleic acid-binding protein